MKMLSLFKAERMFRVTVMASLVFICLIWIGKTANSKSGWQQYLPHLINKQYSLSKNEGILLRVVESEKQEYVFSHAEAP